MEQIHKDRLLRLAEFLEKLPPERFAYDQWVGDDWKGAPDLSCGTKACALGHATTIPEFRALGLRLTKTGGPYLADPNDDQWVGDDEDAGKEIFGLDRESYFFLFHPHSELESGRMSPDSAASAAEVAAHIRSFVEAQP